VLPDGELAYIEGLARECDGPSEALAQRIDEYLEVFGDV
jgi:hypothetical protein